jgi:hypothetical protein
MKDITCTNVNKCSKLAVQYIISIFSNPSVIASCEDHAIEQSYFNISGFSWKEISMEDYIIAQVMYR